jgi:hypothetical protein
MACLAGCQKPSKTAASAPDASVSRFAGTVGQLDAGSAFLKFIGEHEHQTVALDLQFPPDDFQGADGSDFSAFDVWEDCDNLPAGQKPGAMLGCTGFEFNIPSRQAVVQDGAVRRLRGKFRVEPAGGPLQGLMTVKLTPASP